MTGRQTPDWGGRTPVGKKEEVDLLVREPEVLDLLLGYSDTAVFLGCGWGRLVGNDNAGAVRADAGRRRGKPVTSLDL